MLLLILIRVMNTNDITAVEEAHAILSLKEL